MAYNPSPKVRAAEDVGQQFDKCMVVVLMVDTAGTLEYASWGDTRARCAEAKDLADTAFEAIMHPEEDE